MQSERFPSRVHPSPPLASVDEELGREDEELGGEDNEVARDPEARGGGRLLPSVGFLLGAAVLGVMLALIWRNVDGQRWSDMWLWPALSAQPAQSASNSGSEQQIAQVVQELDALKKDVSELRAAQQQIAAGMESLKANQQAVYWYDNRAVLMYPIAAQMPSRLASPRQTPTARVRSEAQDAR